MPLAVHGMGHRRHRAALGVAKHHQNGGVDMRQAILDGPDFIRVTHIAGDPNDKNIHDAGVKNQFHRDARVRAGDNGCISMLALIFTTRQFERLRGGVGINRLAGIKTLIALRSLSLQRD